MQIPVGINTQYTSKGNSLLGVTVICKECAKLQAFHLEKKTQSKEEAVIYDASTQ